jgi:membrane peptidoglycan carboxypeptidase
VQNREQVGSSFKPYVLAAAVKAGMNVQTSTLNGFNNLYIAPDSTPSAYSTTTQVNLSHIVQNDSPSENGPYTPQMAMAVSINTAYADLWHRVGGTAVANIAQELGVNTDAACITASCPGNPHGMKDEAGVALGQASLSVLEQASMLATIDDGGVYHNPHVVASIGHNTQNSAPPIPIKVTSYPVFSPDPTANKNLATQVQYAMSKDDAPYGTAPGAGMSNGQEIIAKTGTTDSAQSAFFIGAIPSQTLAVALFTNEQGSEIGKAKQTLELLGGLSSGGMGGTWPASIWHTYAENMFVPLGVEPFPVPVFTGQTWNQVPPNLRNVGKKPKKHDHGGQNGGRGGDQGGNPTPWPTFSCDPQVVTCTTGGGGGGGNGNGGGFGGGNGGGLGGGPVTGGVGLVVTGLPLWARRRLQHRRLRRTRKAR